jgi:hypothetical protein
MANIPIWPGSSSFGDTANPTPFAFYDTDSDFIIDADRVADWCAKRLGYPLVDIELQQINFYSCFEEAITEYGTQVYTMRIIDTLVDLVGSPTGSPLNNLYITEDYSVSRNTGTSYGGGTENEARIYSASLDVQRGRQKYDLIDTDLVTWQTGSDDIISGSAEIKIKKVYHYQPAAINRYFDPYAGTGTGIQSLMETFGFGNYSPGVNFMLMPIYFDTLKIQAIELNDTIRKSGYHFEINGDRFLKLFPIPTSDYTLWFDYTYVPSSLGGATDLVTGGSRTDFDRVTGIENAPYDNPTYRFINAPGKQWIKKYTLALAKEMLGSIRGKYQSMPIPGSETTLDYTRLLSEASAEKEALVTQLREDLNGTSLLAREERKTSELETRRSADIAEGRYQIYIH